MRNKILFFSQARFGGYVVFSSLSGACKWATPPIDVHVRGDAPVRPCGRNSAAVPLIPRTDRVGARTGPAELHRRRLMSAEPFDILRACDAMDPNEIMFISIERGRLLKLR